METLNTTCIMCPMGCPLTVVKDGDNVTVSGNTCKRGEIYGAQEMKNPMRVVTSLVHTKNGKVVSVKTNNVIPKNRIFDVLKELENVKVENTAKIGDVVIANVLGLCADVVITSNAI